MTDTFSWQLAVFASKAITPGPLVRRVAALSMLDWLSVGLAGVGQPVARATRALALAEGGAKGGAEQAHIFGTTTGVPARMAALVNGATSHALDYDDTHFAHIGHPSVAVIPAALALGEVQGASMAQVTEAALMGMELSIRVGLWLGRAHYGAGFHQTATAGAFGAGAAAGRMLGLDAGQMMQVLGLVATRAAGLRAQFGTDGKPYNAGLAASGGVEAAQLVALGLVANPQALEGPSGFGATHHGEGNVAKALDGLGKVWHFEQVSHKFHACCHGLHAALEAARELDVAAPEVAEMTVATNPRWMDVCNKPAPESGLEAKFSYRTVLAMQAFGYDTGQLDSYSTRVISDPRLVDLRQKIKVVADAAVPETGTRLTVLRRDGATLEAVHDLATPMELPQREDRVRAKAVGLIGEDLVERAWACLMDDTLAARFASLLQVDPDVLQGT
ncbi:MAG: MmgE/PrpD family protein [Rhodobacteraceae bacterium]|nr:MmgE/PrpD family protein [Paracoccaceae bacterium]